MWQVAAVTFYANGEMLITSVEEKERERKETPGREKGLNRKRVRESACDISKLTRK